MTGISGLWLPILLSAVFVFLASSVLHMALPWHRSDLARVPREDEFRAAVGPLAVPPGDYMVPRAMSMAEMKTPEFAEKLSQGPNLVMTVLPTGPFTMGKNLALWFVYSLVVSLFAAYIAGRALPSGPDTDYLEVFRFAGATAFIGYSLALWQMTIWYQRSWVTTAKSTVDGLVYALLTAGTFGWLWP
jgi:hypothetical protein